MAYHVFVAAFFEALNQGDINYLSQNFVVMDLVIPLDRGRPCGITLVPSKRKETYCRRLKDKSKSGQSDL